MESSLMKLDPHTHSSPVSLCSHVPPEELVHLYKKAGLDAVVLTNHCIPFYWDQFGSRHEDRVRGFLKDYDRAVRAGRDEGLKVLFGAEAVVIREMEDNGEKKIRYADFLLYGLKPEQLVRQEPELGRLSQQELFDFCNANNVLMVQAHPCRYEQNHCPADVRLMHGVELFNPHSQSNHMETVLQMQREGDLLVTAGSDFHYVQEVGRTGLMVDRAIETAEDLRDYLFTRRHRIFVQPDLPEADQIPPEFLA